MPNVPLEKDQFWFRSALFEIEPGEDAETNPSCYGRALAKWLAGELRREGLEVDDVFPEDWGWCVMVRRAPFQLWIGCGNVHSYENERPDDALPRGEDVVWTCIVVAEVPLLKRLFRRPVTTPAVKELYERVKRIVSTAPATTLVEEP